MKFLTLFVTVFVMFATNVFAQPTGTPAASADPTAPAAQPPTTPSPTPPTTPTPVTVDPRIDQCVSNGGGEACCGGLVACQDVQVQLGQERREQMDTAANAYGESPEQYGRRLCRSIGGSWGDLWNGSDWKANCECHSPREWDANHEFCLPPNADYLERLCRESGGRWTGGYCDCLGRQREGGRCTGRNRLEELEAQIAELQTRLSNLQTARDNLATERDSLQGQLTQATTELQQVGVLQGQLTELEESVQGMDLQMAALDAEITGLRNLRDLQRQFIEEQGLLIAELGGIPPVPPGFAPGEIPGAAESTAEVAIDSTRPPVGEVPTVEEDDETGCGGWCIAGIVAGALVIGLGTWAIVEYTTTYTLVNNP